MRQVLGIRRNDWVLAMLYSYRDHTSFSSLRSACYRPSLGLIATRFRLLFICCVSFNSKFCSVLIILFRYFRVL